MEQLEAPDAAAAAQSAVSSGTHSPPDAPASPLGSDITGRLSSRTSLPNIGEGVQSDALQTEELREAVADEQLSQPLVAEYSAASVEQIWRAIDAQLDIFQGPQSSAPAVPVLHEKKTGMPRKSALRHSSLRPAQAVRIAAAELPRGRSNAETRLQHRDSRVSELMAQVGHSPVNAWECQSDGFMRPYKVITAPCIGDVPILLMARPLPLQQELADQQRLQDGRLGDIGYPAPVTVHLVRSLSTRASLKSRLGGLDHPEL